MAETGKWVAYNILSVLGIIVTLFRCFTYLTYKMSYESVKVNLKVFKIKTFWLPKLREWRESEVYFWMKELKLFVYDGNENL